MFKSKAANAVATADKYGAVPQSDKSELPAGCTVTFYSIYYRVKTRSGPPYFNKVKMKEILTDINGIMSPGMNAILGPTGSGKSSLLDILAARKAEAGLTGELLLDGAPQPPNFKCISGYVIQDDVVMGTLTVRENLQFSAALRLPRHIGRIEQNKRIDKVIKELGLTEVANSKVGTQLIRGVSGGERKRTNIGMELIINPTVLFLDEPTTGLDASTAHAVLLLLKRMSKQGKTIIFSIHQPRYSIFKLFDSLTLLANGRMIFQGPAFKALDYFATIDMDFEALFGKTETTLAEKLAIMFSKSTYSSEMMAKLKQLSEAKKGSESFHRQIMYSTSFSHQLKWLTKRSFKNLLRSPQTSVAQILVSLSMGLVVGALSFGVKNDLNGIQNRVGALFFMTTNLCFSSLSAIELFVIEKKIFIHEYISGYYRIFAYFLSKLLVDLIPMRALPATVLATVTYFMIGLKQTVSAFLTLVLTLIQVSTTATSMALAISTGYNVVAVANLLVTLCFIFMVILSGLLVNLVSIVSWLSWLQYLSIPRYGLRALQINEFTGLKFCNNSHQLHTIGSKCHPGPEFIICTGEQYLHSQGIDATAWGLWQNHVALILMMVIFLMISYAKLCFMKKFS
ncbi:broad substrate specificity ATP-binding cassette transporter ABCG2 isoform X2 [Callorhinchus milii]|uniref:broad substrate specificity ATP-binding cassette transporter ABCG2 isoform X2 n=1 Tax=Callorhinchus milii TaxID=7868 RepID=UPI0004571D20|nr:broad substrate specificity ATP-binding cassette transporter ABCG2 isoform X2 [Callorhinchus milii]|eukprot:gi/632949414/ref/XP_007890144.1/ PREDICTED: ATP-binding cassette sub-family G member 2-like isoform X2 [Callorhinchus milii]